MTYPEWLEYRIAARRTLHAPTSLVFSILTSVYARTAEAYFAELRDSVLGQSYRGLEWIVLAHGPISNGLSDILEALSTDGRCRVLRLPVNLGIIGALRHCLSEARGQYVVPIDADDLLTPDALRVLSYFIETQNKPAFLYSDEDQLFNGVAATPYFRPDFDPVLLITSSYIWHLCAIRRDAAVELGLYTESEFEWCHDWDTALRVLRSALPVVHVPEVLYHWRHHEASSTNRPDPESGSLLSQKRVLEAHIRIQPQPDLYCVEPSPIFRGAFEWWIRRKPVHPPRAALIVVGESPAEAARAVSTILRRSRFPFAEVFLCGCLLDSGDRRRVSDLANARGERAVRVHHIDSLSELSGILVESAVEWAAMCSGQLDVEGDLWPWECQKMYELHPDVAVVAGRVLDQADRVIGGAEIFGYDGVVGCPDAGKHRADAGYFALSLKQRCVSAPSSVLFSAKKDILCAALNDSKADGSGLGAWLGGHAAAHQKKVAYTPIFSGVRRDGGKRTVRIGFEESRIFLRRFGEWVPDHRWYSASFGPAYAVGCVDPGLPRPAVASGSKKGY